MIIMTQVLRIAAVLLFAILVFTGCKKELSCENCQPANKPPIAKAGADQKIVLPVDTFMLDGSASSDLDGTITSYTWSKLFGPAQINLINSSSSITTVQFLKTGVYLFELTVTDNGGLSGRDTVQIVVDDPSINHPPVAKAGTDQIITLPTDSVNLDATGSFDPDGSILAYSWGQISGPNVSSTRSTLQAKVTLNNLIIGNYQFELTVTDNENLSAKDTVQIIVNLSSANTCLPFNDSIYVVGGKAKLIPIGNLSQPRSALVSATSNNKIIFAGGMACYDGDWKASTRVDIYDLTTHNWSTAELSAGGASLTAVVAGNKILIAGGYDDVQVASGKVDIYDVSANTWSTEKLSEGNHGLAAIAIGNKILIAGDYGEFTSSKGKVDIYDVTTNTWINTKLSKARRFFTLASAGNKAFIAGGNDLSSSITRVDIYDGFANTWSTTELSERREGLATASVGNFLFFAGGHISGTYFRGDLTVSNKVDIYNELTNTWSNVNLSEARMSIAAINIHNKVLFAGGFTNHSPSKKVDIFNHAIHAWSVADLSVERTNIKTARLGSKVLFALGNNNNGWSTRLDIYDAQSDKWIHDDLSLPIIGTSFLSTNNNVYIAGGYLNNSATNKVWKIEF